MVLGLLLSGNAIAATPFTYLSCKQIIKVNNSTHEAFVPQNEWLKIGAYNSHIFYKFKDTSKKITVTVYEHGDMLRPAWKEMKPAQKYKVKFEYDKKDMIYSFGEQGLGLTIGYAIQSSNGDYYQTTIFKYKKEVDLAMDSKCDKVEKKEFNKLIKKGIK